MEIDELKYSRRLKHRDSHLPLKPSSETRFRQRSLRSAKQHPIQLTKPIIFFDLETTGTNTAQDRILQIGAIIITPDGQREEKNVLLNPGIPIPAGATAVHGISDEVVSRFCMKVEYKIGLGYCSFGKPNEQLLWSLQTWL